MTASSSGRFFFFSSFYVLEMTFDSCSVQLRAGWKGNFSLYLEEDERRWRKGHRLIVRLTHSLSHVHLFFLSFYVHGGLALNFGQKNPSSCCPDRWCTWVGREEAAAAVLGDFCLDFEAGIFSLSLISTHLTLGGGGILRTQVLDISLTPKTFLPRAKRSWSDGKPSNLAHKFPPLLRCIFLSLFTTFWPSTRLRAPNHARSSLREIYC